MVRRNPADHTSTTVLSALAAMSATPFSSLSQLADAYLSLIMRQLGVRSAFVSAFTPSAQQVLVFRDEAGGSGPLDAVVPLEDTFCQFVRSSSLPVIILDTGSDARVSQLVARLGLAIGSYAGVPILLSDGTVYGTLCALDPAPHDFPPAHIDLLRIAANHIAFWVEREQAHQADLDACQEPQRTVAPSIKPDDQQINVLHMVAHDLRTPLSGVIGFAELLQDGVFEPVSAEQYAMLEHIKRAGVFANRLVTDIVDAAASEQPALRMMTSSFSPSELAAHVAQICQPKAAEKQLALRIECAEPPAAMVGDAERLQQVLYNLLSNAIHYTERGDVTLSIAAQSDEIEFQVRDTGPGIPPEQQARIWEMYSRATSLGNGLGLGLAVVKNLVQAMGGRVGLESRVGAGSMFWVRLPQRVANLAPIRL